MSFSVGNHELIFKDTEDGKIDQAVSAAAAKAWLKVVPKVTITDVGDTGV